MATNGSFAQQEQFSASTGPATDSNKSSGDVGKDEVGWYFVESYYTMLSKNPERLHACLPFLGCLVMLTQHSSSTTNRLNWSVVKREQPSRSLLAVPYVLCILFSFLSTDTCRPSKTVSASSTTKTAKSAFPMSTPKLPKTASSSRSLVRHQTRPASSRSLCRLSFLHSNPVATLS